MEQESLHIFIENNGHAATPRIEYILKLSFLKYSPLSGQYYQAIHFKT